MAKRAPRGLDAATRRWWLRYSRLLKAEGHYHSCDSVWLELLARASAEREAAERDLSERGYYVEYPSGHRALSPAYTVAREARKRELQLLAQGPLTPAARARLAERAAPEMPDMEALLAGQL